MRRAHFALIWPEALKCPPHVLEGLDRQPRRDRGQSHSCLRGARDRHRGGLLRARPRRAARQARRRGLPARARARRARAISRSTSCSTRSSAPGPRRCIPGYGFLAENAGFAKALEERGTVFIGPPSSAIEAMGSKTRARELMRAAGVPIVPGTTEPVETVDDARKVIEETIGYPVAVKAAGGGGGKGFRVALSDDQLEAAFEGAAREGEKFFSDATVYLERYLPDPRHVEVQVLADSHGNVIHLGERDCSLQRRHQKLIEEAPAPAVDAELRARIGKIATEAAAAVNYTGAGTIEGLLAGRRVLLPRDEHPRPGGALRDRDGDRDRHRQGGDPGRGRRAAVDLPGGRASCAGTRSSAGSTPRTRARTSPPLPARSAPTASRRVRACASTRASVRGRRSRRCTTRWSPS